MRADEAARETDEDAPEGAAFVVDVDGFEGPLDLLLELARRQKVDLARISILALVEQYLMEWLGICERRRGGVNGAGGAQPAPPPPPPSLPPKPPPPDEKHSPPPPPGYWNPFIPQPTRSAASVAATQPSYAKFGC